MCVLIEGYGYVFIEGFQTDKKNPAHQHLNFKWIKKSRPHKHALSFTTNMKFYLVKWIKVKKKEKKEIGRLHDRIGGFCDRSPNSTIGRSSHDRSPISVVGFYCG